MSERVISNLCRWIPLFGNNDCYDEWIAFIREEGIEVDDENCYRGYIQNVDKAITVLSRIVWRHKAMCESLFDFTDSVDRWCGDDSDRLLDVCERILDGTIPFLPYTFYQVIKDKVIESWLQRGYGSDRLHHIELKDGEKVEVWAG